MLKAPVRGVQRAGRASFALLDAAANRLYGWRYNPLYHSGALVVASFVVLTVTGLYLLLFYRIGAPYESVERIASQPFAGRWIRTLHRYASDLAVVAAVVHALRMLVQDRTWGPRALAWISGVVLLGVFYVCGWTGYVMVWDGHAQVLAVEGARLLDALPVFSEPLVRTFTGERAIPSAFFFLNLFAHIALPVGVLLVLWVHVSKVARARLMPPRPLSYGALALVTGVSVLWPAPLPSKADVLTMPSDVGLDIFYSFWVPLVHDMSVGVAWLVVLVALGLLLAVPLLTRPRAQAMPAPSYVDPRRCTGCEQCYHDCPYEAISMVRRDDGRPGFVGLVDPSKCVSCGICAGSCAPMGVGPAGRTGRDQLADVKHFIARVPPSSERVVLVGCANSAAGDREELGDAAVYSASCAGAVHTSVIEYLIRAGWGGVMIVACPPRDCWNREGPIWLEERVYNDREAELQQRVDRRRVRIVHAAEGERGPLVSELTLFESQVRALQRALGETDPTVGTACEPPELSVAEEVAP